jgi:hypothetical protein
MSPPACCAKLKSYALRARGLAEDCPVSRKALPALVAALLLGSAAAWYFWPHIAPQPAPPPPVATPAPLPAPDAGAIAHPLPVDAAPLQPLPALADSDAPFTSGLLALPGAAALRSWLHGSGLIHRIVATVDDLARPHLASEIRPLRAAPGAFMVQGTDDAATIDDRNAARYEPLLAIVRAVDVRSAAALYRQYYPLFQEAYRSLGYPQGYFNDRLVAVIDQLLATPEPQQPLQLRRTKVFWEFADPELESLSAGQKLLLRLGPRNGAELRARLRELRAAIG